MSDKLPPPDKPLPSSFDSTPEFFEESRWQKFSRRLKEEPLIPLGCFATCFALWRAYRSMKAGDSAQLNRMFRARIYAQAFTLTAVVAGSFYYKAERAQQKELEAALEQRKAQEKRDLWLRELEIRDQEDRDWRERHAAIERAARNAENKQQNVADSAVEPENGQPGGVLHAVRELVGKN